MADSKTPRSSKPGSSPRLTSSKRSTAGSKSSRPASTSSPKRSTSTSSPKIVRSEPRTYSSSRRITPEEPVEFHPVLDPERIGKWLHDRMVWMDELLAIVLIVFGFVSIFSLLNTSSTVSLSTMWSDILRQLFGYGGAFIACGMIISAGLLIVLPHIGIRIPMRWTRVVIIEVAYFSLLALVHILAHDPEPRALAASGQGGGYIGWVLSEPLVRLLGAGLAGAIYGLILVIGLSNALGIKRRHIRQFLLGISQAFAALAERMKRPPQPRHVRQPRVQQAQAVAMSTNGGTDMPNEGFAPNRPEWLSHPGRATAPTNAIASSPLHTSHPASQAIDAGISPTPTSPLRPYTRPVETRTAEAAKPLSPVTAQVGTKLDSKPGSRPVSKPGSKTGSKAVPRQPVQERRKRYFTVDDFQEIRKVIPRAEYLPPLTLLSNLELNKPTEQEINNNVRIIENTLLEFDIDVEVVDVKVGPTVTQYAVQPFREVTNQQGEVVMQRVRVNKISALTSDLALALAAKRLRIQPYVPGHPYMGIEVPNRQPSTVALRPVMESETFAYAFLKPNPDVPGQLRELPLTVPLGRDVSGGAFVVDLATMPHLLIAGTTGSGKSVCITAIASALIINNSPERLNLVMLDPKMVELTRFNGIPHLLGPVETELERIIGVLRWATREMDHRYKLLEVEACRNIEAYNRALGRRRQSEHLPYIVILVDEIGDLMLSRPDEVERTLTRLAQMARAVGIHLVVATQRPSVDIITGLIKANFPARISFAVASGIDSRVILDTTGAETLMGRGDMLYLAPDAAGPQRLQGCFISDDEIDAVIAHWKAWQAQRIQEDPSYQQTVAPWERGLTRRESLNETDPLLEDAIDLVVREGEASASLIQRRLGIGYPRAAQLLDMLGELGVVGSLKDGGRSREVLLKPGQDKYKKLMDKRRSR